MLLIIDGDPIPYRCSNAAIAKGLNLEGACNYVDNLVKYMFFKTKADSYVAFLQGYSNFRDEVTSDYKEGRNYEYSRRGYYNEVKDYFVSTYKPYFVTGAEADDACVIMHQRNPGSVLASIDKDLLQSQGIHYNYATQDFLKVEWPGSIHLTKKGKVKSTGVFKLWHQMLMGDAVDNIKGIPGIGPKKAMNILINKKVEDLPRIVFKQYRDHFGNQAVEEYRTNYRLLNIIKYSDTMINPKPINIHNGNVQKDQSLPLSVQTILGQSDWLQGSGQLDLP